MQVFRITERDVGGVIGLVKIHTVYFVFPGTSYPAPLLSQRVPRVVPSYLKEEI